MGGTSWLYISGEPFDKLGFQKLPEKPVGQLTESIQHGLFRYFWAPATLFGLLGGAMWWTHQNHSKAGGDSAGKEESQ